MEKIWTELYEAAKRVLDPRNVSDIIEAGGVAAAVESVSGKITLAYASTVPAHLAYALKETLYSI